MTDAARLRSFVECIENLDAEIKQSNDDKRDIYKEAKGAGFDPQAVKDLVRYRRDPTKADQRSAAFDEYLVLLNTGSKNNAPARNSGPAKGHPEKVAPTRAGARDETRASVPAREGELTSTPPGSPSTNSTFDRDALRDRAPVKTPASPGSAAPDGARLGRVACGPEWQPHDEGAGTNSEVGEGRKATEATLPSAPLVAAVGDAGERSTAATLDDPYNADVRTTIFDRTGESVRA